MGGNPDESSPAPSKANTMPANQIPNDYICIKHGQQMIAHSVPGLELFFAHRILNNELTPNPSALPTGNLYSCIVHIVPWVNFLLASINT